jgi:hypothetical protein
MKYGELIFRKANTMEKDRENVGVVIPTEE